MGSSEDWLSVMASLKDRYYCLAIDLPGHGKTLLPDIESSQMMDKVVKEIPRFLLDAGIKESFLISYSLGGRLALQMAFDNSVSWKGIVLESASPGIQDPQQRQERLNHDFRIADELEDRSFENFLQNWYRQSIFGSIIAKPGFDKLLIQRKKNDPLKLAEALRGMSVGRQNSYWLELKNLSVPVKYICGELDSKYTDIAKNMNQANPAISVEIIQNTGHVVHLEQPEKYTYLVRKFISGHN